MSVLKAGCLRMTKHRQVGFLGEEYAVYQVHDQDDQHVVARIGLTKETLRDLIKLLLAQQEVDRLSAIVEPLISATSPARDTHRGAGGGP